MEATKDIIAIVGPSGSGKTTLGLYLSKQLGYNWISSYTTRPKREGETDGVDHHFADVGKMPPRSEMVAYTVFGGNHYWTELRQFTEDVPNVYVIDEKGLVELNGNIASGKFGNLRVMSVHVCRDSIDVDPGRMSRDLDRVSLPEDEYDIVIENNGDLAHFLEYGADVIFENANYKFKK